jgi:hypothetical protein
MSRAETLGDNGFERMDSPTRLKKNPGFFRDLLAFLLENKKWWLIPVILVILFTSILIILGGSASAPFIYTLF